MAISSATIFKVYKLGPLIGERTWGGVRGIRGEIPLDRWRLYHASGIFALWSGQQVADRESRRRADIEIDNRPDLVRDGHDPQLEKAIELVMKEIQEHPMNCRRGPRIFRHTRKDRASG